MAQSLRLRLGALQNQVLPDLASCTSELSLHQQLATDARADLALCRRLADELAEEVENQSGWSAAERENARREVAELRVGVEDAAKQYRQAVLRSKRAIEASNSAAQRAQLLGSSSASARGAATSKGPTNEDEALMTATSDVTEGLRRTLALMEQEVSRSFQSHELLTSQTKTIQLTSDQYTSLNSLLTASKTLITALSRADVLDRLLLGLALAFFALTCLWILKRRVLDKGLRVAKVVGGAVAGKKKSEIVAAAREATTVFTSTVLAAVTAAAATATKAVELPPVVVEEPTPEPEAFSAVPPEPTPAPTAFTPATHESPASAPPPQPPAEPSISHTLREEDASQADETDPVELAGTATASDEIPLFTPLDRVHVPRPDIDAQQALDDNALIYSILDFDEERLEPEGARDGHGIHVQAHHRGHNDQPTTTEEEEPIPGEEEIPIFTPLKQFHPPRPDMDGQRALEANAVPPPQEAGRPRDEL